MTDRARTTITIATAVALGGSAYGHAFDLNLPGILDDVWSGLSEAAVYGMAIVGVSLVYRWWALLPALAPVAVTVYLNTMTDYVSPWHEETSDASEHPAQYALLVVAGVLLNAAFLSIGLLARAIGNGIRSRRRRYK
jgi:hypothetical protein